MFCTETHNFWTLMYVMLGLTYLFVLTGIIASLQNGLIFNIVFLGLAGLIYLMQAFYFRQFHEAYERAFAVGAPVGHPE
jgi:predicted membrane channel-forming protein YqfA (hemolysin III family)